MSILSHFGLDLLSIGCKHQVSYTFLPRLRQISLFNSFEDARVGFCNFGLQLGGPQYIFLAQAFVQLTCCAQTDCI